MTYYRCTDLKVKKKIRPDHFKCYVSVHTEIFWFQILGILSNLSTGHGTGINKLKGTFLQNFPFALHLILLLSWRNNRENIEIFFEIFISNEYHWPPVFTLLFLPWSCMVYGYFTFAKQIILHLREVSPCTDKKKDQKFFPAFPEILYKQILQSIFCFTSITLGKILQGNSYFYHNLEPTQKVNNGIKWDPYANILNGFKKERK